LIPTVSAIVGAQSLVGMVTFNQGYFYDVLGSRELKIGSLAPAKIGSLAPTKIWSLTSENWVPGIRNRVPTGPYRVHNIFLKKNWFHICYNVQWSNLQI